MSLRLAYLLTVLVIAMPSAAAIAPPADGCSQEHPDNAEYRRYCCPSGALGNDNYTRYLQVCVLGFSELN